jgi:aspartyl-tRNA(Asn)/glutamyl-tRNA(Gln) amidotransferase subunit B
MIMEYEAVIGLEVHAELKTNTKIFSAVTAKFGDEPNTNINELCLGMPGTLPVLNKRVAELALKTCMALNFEITRESAFERKNYFYPDLPKGYQISQYERPIGTNGYLDIEVEGKKKRVNITRVHMEEDAGKLVHAGAERLAGSSYSLADYNRAGVPLVEIVSEPEIRSSEEAKAYMEELRNILMYADVCDGKMQEGSMRCDANVSVRPKGTEKFGTRVEIKNLNSFRSLQRAIDYEIDRQIDAIESGEKIIQETRLWDENKGYTASMRSKEEAEDYRYFPDPDLVTLVVDDEWLEKVRQEMPELPAKKKERYINEFNLSEYDAKVLVSSLDTVKFFDEMVLLGANPKIAVNWVTVNLMSYLNETKKEFSELNLKASDLKELLDLIEKGTISNKIAKDVLVDMLNTGEKASSIVEKKGLTQISNTDELASMVQKLVEGNQNQVTQYLAGKEKVLGFFVGQIMKETKGRANPELINTLILEEINKYRK